MAGSKRQVIEIDVTFESNYDGLSTSSILSLLQQKRVKNIKITNVNKRKEVNSERI